MGEVLLEIPASPEYLALARQVVAAAAALEPTFADGRIDDLRVAVSEAATNAVEALAGLDSDDRVIIRCDLADDRIEVEVHDVGEGFDPEAARALEAPGPEDPDRLDFERGLGIPLMRAFADEAEISSDDQGTVVRLTVFTPAEKRRRDR